MEAREAAWQNLGGSSSFFTDTQGVEDNVDFSKTSKDLIEAHKLLTRLWWNIRSLEEYLRLGIIPRGLRVQIFPAWEATTDFKDSWETGLLQCSKIIINMLLNHDKTLVQQTKIRIKTLETTLATFDIPTLVTPFQTKLKDLIDKYEKDIIAGKKRKFVRDKTDYDKKVAYKWKHQGNARGRTGPMGYTKKATPSTQDSATSDFLSSSDTDAGPGGEERNPKKRTLRQGGNGSDARAGKQHKQY